jgi:hypothetical protein
MKAALQFSFKQLLNDLAILHASIIPYSRLNYLICNIAYEQKKIKIKNIVASRIHNIYIIKLVCC